MRIVSFLPGATEMVYELGLGDSLVGISHACRPPPDDRSPEVLVQPALDLEGKNSGQVDGAVARWKKQGKPLYQVDEKRFRALSPDLVLTQDLCEVCAPSGDRIDRVVESMTPSPKTLSMTPRNLEGIFRNMNDLGEVAGVSKRARQWRNRARGRLDDLNQSIPETSRRPRVFCMEWIDPPYFTGHWVPQQVERAGGRDELGKPGGKSGRLPWREVRRYDPEWLLLMPCGFDTERVVREAKRLVDYEGFSRLSAARRGQIYALDARTYFTRPGPGVVEGTQLLAHLFRPDRVSWEGSPGAAQRLDLCSI